MTALQTVHVRVNDAGTGQPSPCRVRFTDAAGAYYAPLGRLREFATEVGIDVGGNLLLEGQAHAYIDGTCEIALPPGRILIAIDKGPEYRPFRGEVSLAPGRLALRFVLERWTDLRAERWYSGDTRCHFLTPHAALLEGAAEDLAVVNLLCREAPAFGSQEKPCHALANLLAFSGQRPALQTPGHMVVVGTMNTHPTLGQLLLLNCHRVVYPLTFGGPEQFDSWTLSDWCDQCHRKAGLVIGEGFFEPITGHAHGELLADLLLGKVDALNYNLGQDTELTDWYGLLDLGLRIPLTAGSGKDSNRRALGSPRTYARLEAGQDLTYKNWIEAVRAGRTFVTSGPLLLLTVNDLDPEAVIDLPATAPTVRIRAEARSTGPLDVLEIIANQAVMARAQAVSSPAILEAEAALPAGGWVLARCRGPQGLAQTSPIYVRREGQRPPSDPAIWAHFAGYLEEMLQWVAREGRFENDAQRERLARIFQDARHFRQAGKPNAGS